MDEEIKLANLRLSRIEALLTQVWGKHLPVDELNLDSNFFEKGGDSLAALKINNDLVDTLDTEIGRAHV